MKLARRRGWASLSILCLLGCGTSEFASDLQYGMDATVDGSVIEGGGFDAAPPGCDASMDPKDSPACVDDSFGIFVSPMGSDGAAGTKLAPLQTITAALGKTSATKNRVYICEGTYAEAVTLTSSVNLYGGFSCTDWSYNGHATKVAPSVPGIALSIAGVSAGATIEDLEFDAMSGAAAGDSSIAVFVSNAQNVLFRRVTAKSGDGHDGADPVAKKNYNEALPASDASIKGQNAAADQGGPTQGCSGLCVNGTHSLGGKGGDANLAGQDGGPNLAGTAPFDGVGGPFSGICANGHPGASASGADGGAGGALKSGSLQAGGWTLLSGLAGSDGPVAQGGGGGSGGAAAGAGGGGGGGCGGCGGAGGVGGMSGGSSMALVSFMSAVTLDSCTLKSAKGGVGKPGGAPEVGQTGGARGDAVGGGTGCQGAAGGLGGAGAGGGGGAGGHSIAVAYHGTAPTEVGTNMKVPSTAGNGGAGGTGGAPPAGSGATGTAAPSFALP